MAYDAFRRLMTPDFEARNELPQWQPMGEDNQGDQIAQSTGSFVDLLKKRMAQKNETKGVPGADEGKAAMMGAEGMQSL